MTEQMKTDLTDALLTALKSAAETVGDLDDLERLIEQARSIVEVVKEAE